jgi:hypothetical protein
MVDRPLWLLQIEDPAAAGAGGEPAGVLTNATIQHSLAPVLVVPAGAPGP